MVRQSESNKAETARKPPLTDKQVATMLNRADIILTHGGDLPARVIRLVTHSYWNHVAFVALLSDAASESEQGYQRTFVLEAEADRGVDIHPVDKYLDNKRQDIAILRFPDLALGGEDCAVNFLRRVRGFALEEIDAVYGYGAILRILATALGPLSWLLRPIIRAVRVATSFNRKKAINDFICSGVAQCAYYRACLGAKPDTGEFWDPFFQKIENRRNLIVSKEIRDTIDLEGDFDSVAERLKVTTPADFSRAVAAGLLRCVAQRVKGDWQEGLTKV